MDKAQTRCLTADWFALDLNAYTAGAPLRVLSAHAGAVNLQVDGWPHLLIVTGPGLERGPASIGLDGNKLKALQLYLRQGAAGLFAPGLIRFTAADQELLVSWRGVPAVSFARPRRLELNPAKIGSALERYRQWLPHTGIDSPSSVLFGLPGGEAYFRQEIETHFPPAINALLANNKQEFQYSCRSMIGIGRGLTPTGDDLVYGALVANCWVTGMRWEEGQEPCLPEEYGARTTFLGRHMVEMGMRGLAAEPVGDMIASLLKGNPSLDLLQRLCRIGSSTGYDIAVAIFYFMKTALHTGLITRDSR